MLTSHYVDSITPFIISGIRKACIVCDATLLDRLHAAVQELSYRLHADGFSCVLVLDTADDTTRDLVDDDGARQGVLLGARERADALLEAVLPDRHRSRAVFRTDERLVFSASVAVRRQRARHAHPEHRRPEGRQVCRLPERRVCHRLGHRSAHALLWQRLPLTVASRQETASNESRQALVAVRDSDVQDGAGGARDAQEPGRSVDGTARDDHGQLRGTRVDPFYDGAYPVVQSPEVGRRTGRIHRGKAEFELGALRSTTTTTSAGAGAGAEGGQSAAPEDTARLH